MKDSRPEERVMVVCPLPPERVTQGMRGAEGRMEEAAGLAEAIDLEVVQKISLRLAAITSATYIGSGKVEELGGIIAAEDISLVVFDAQLSPAQQSNLEKAWKCKVIDRTALILEIFGQRARTREGRLQVELARLNYQKGRLVRAWSHLERQRGGSGFTGGPGEKQIELDKRMLRDRIKELETELEHVVRTRELHRKNRRAVPYPVVALVGYTNAGKSTLFNRLTGADVLADDMLFATLDPTLRIIRLPSGVKIMLSDTVGFVSNLPTTLIAAFRATLEEVLGADIIIHVRDISHEESEIQKDDVLRVLRELDVDSEEMAGIVEVWNKSDTLDAETRARLAEQQTHEDKAILISALSGEGIEHLLAVIEQQITAKYRNESIKIGVADGRLHAWIKANSQLLSEKLDGDFIEYNVRISEENLNRINRLLADSN